MAQLLSVLCSELSKGCRRMSHWWSWNRLCCKCERLVDKYGGKDEIPLDPDDPLEVFDDTNVENNVMRFVVYILWLKRQPDSFEKYLRVSQSRFDLWRSSVYKVWLLRKRRERSSLRVRYWQGIGIHFDQAVWDAWPDSPRPMRSQSNEPGRYCNEIWGTHYTNRVDDDFLQPP